MKDYLALIYLLLVICCVIRTPEKAERPKQDKPYADEWAWWKDLT